MADDFYIYHKNLPHWRQSGVIYFVTWRLHRFQVPLQPSERSLVFAALTHFSGQRYELGAYVVMDDHVHVLVCPLHPLTLDQILKSWRSFTANQLQRRHARVGEVWQNEPYDRIVRDKGELEEKTRYILSNPFKRWVDITEYPWVGQGHLVW